MGACCDFTGSQVSISALAYVLSREGNYFHHWFHFTFFFPSDFLSWIILGWSQGNFRRRKWGNTYFLWILDSSYIKTIFISIDTVTIKVLKLQWQNEKRNGHSYKFHHQKCILVIIFYNLLNLKPYNLIIYSFVTHTAFLIPTF